MRRRLEDKDRSILTTFSDLGLPAPILKALEAEGYQSPTPIQERAIPHVLAGRDLLGIAQTGTGKTAAFSLPILSRLAADPVRVSPKACRVLVLSPTRELASQIEANIISYGRNLRLRSTLVFGGVPINRQIRACAGGIDIVVATPGRLLDLLSQRAITLAEVSVFVLDEADRMLDLGFMRDIQKIVQMLPKKRQNLFFSATMPTTIAKFAASLLVDPVEVSVTPPSSTVDRIEQKLIHVANRDKQAMLHRLLTDASISRALVFTRTKHGADKVVKHLNAAGIKADAIHGNKSQGQRERALGAFRAGQSRLLVATDIAARGIDVDGVTHVINFEIPNIAETYVHRIGRTARAGAEGSAISLVGEDERTFLRDIERLIRQPIPVLTGVSSNLETLPPLAKSVPQKPGGQQNRREAPGRRDARPPRRQDRPTDGTARPAQDQRPQEPRRAEPVEGRRPPHVRRENSAPQRPRDAGPGQRQAQRPR